MEPSWDQVATKPDPTSNQKNDHFLVGLRNDFGWILAPNLPPKRRNSNLQISTFLVLGAILAPRRPQDAPRSPKRRPRQPPRTILEPFWWICWLFFGWFGGSFRLLLLVVVLVCCLVGALVCWFLGLLARCFAGFLVCWLSVCRLSGPRVQGTVSAGPQGS